MSFLSSLGKAVAFTAAPFTWAAARGVELVTGKDDIVRNNPLTYYTDLFKGSDASKAPSGGSSPVQEGEKALHTYGEGGEMDYEKAIQSINALANQKT